MATSISKIKDYRSKKYRSFKRSLGVFAYIAYYRLNVSGYTIKLSKSELALFAYQESQWFVVLDR